MTFESRAFALLMAVALGAPALSFGQSREQKISQVLRAMASLDLPISRKEILPQLANVQTRSELEQVGKRLELGAEWKPGNQYWDRAEAALRKDFESGANRRTDRDQQREANLRETLGELSNAQLDEVLRFYNSDLLRKSTRMADAWMAMLTLSITIGGQEPDPKTTRRIENLQREIERNGLTPQEEQRLDQAMQSPALQLLTRGGAAGLVSGLRDPSSLLRPAPTQATIKEVFGLIAQFREAHKVPLPLPPAYDADFIVDVARERASRDSANAAMRDDKQALARIVDGAKSGDAIAQAELGRMYGIGRGVAKDEKAAFEWTQRAAQQGFARALFNLGVYYENGIAVDASQQDAVDNYRRAAEKGFARAQLALGLLSRSGKGVPQDFQRSLELIAAAAMQRLPAAELAMAEIFDAGAGVARDERAANMWLDRARAQQYEPATQYLQQRDKRKAELAAFVKGSPPSARASATAVDKAELNRRLLDAVKNVNIDYVRELLDAGADVETRDDRPNLGETPLHHAARTGNINLAKLLVAKGANVNVTGPSGFIPLHVAAGLNRRAMAEYLIAAGANPNAMDHVGTPLHAATLQGHASMVSLLLAKGGDPNARRALDGYTPLHMLSQVNQYFPSHNEIIATLVRHGADINAKSNDGRTPLDGADRNAIAALVMKDALPSSAERFELLRRAAHSGNREPLEYLERRGVALNTISRDGTTLLHVAAAEKDQSALNYLLEKRLDINAANNEGQTPLYAATFACNKPNVELLIKKGARANRVSPGGTTALHALLVSGFNVYWEDCEATIDSLLVAGADPRIRDKEGKTPLHEVAEQRRLLERMLKAGADPRARDNGGQTPLHAFGSYGKRPEAVDTLVKAGADPNAQDAKGRTPLHLFSQWSVGLERLEIARALLRNGARADVRDNEGQTPLEAFAKTPYGQKSRDGTDPPFMRLLKGEKP